LGKQSKQRFCYCSQRIVLIESVNCKRKQLLKIQRPLTEKKTAFN